MSLKTTPVTKKPPRPKKSVAPATHVVKHRASAVKHTATAVGVPEKREYVQTVGRRKSAVARLRFYPRGQGAITINTKDYRQYFPYVFWQEIVTEALPLVGMSATVDISVNVAGGGLPAQAEAVRLALARALIIHNPDWRPA